MPSRRRFLLVVIVRRKRKNELAPVLPSRKICKLIFVFSVSKARVKMSMRIIENMRALVRIILLYTRRALARLRHGLQTRCHRHRYARTRARLSDFSDARNERRGGGGFRSPAHIFEAKTVEEKKIPSSVCLLTHVRIEMRRVKQSWRTFVLIANSLPPPHICGRIRYYVSKIRKRRWRRLARIRLNFCLWATNAALCRILLVLIKSKARALYRTVERLVASHTQATFYARAPRYVLFLRVLLYASASILSAVAIVVVAVAVVAHLTCQRCARVHAKFGKKTLAYSQMRPRCTRGDGRGCGGGACRHARAQV